MKLPVTAYLVLMHHQEAGTFSPAFPTLDEAEEFSNAMRAITSGLAVAEPIPMVQTTTVPAKVNGGLFVDH
jgi:hypothetical protein